MVYGALRGKQTRTVREWKKTIWWHMIWLHIKTSNEQNLLFQWIRMVCTAYSRSILFSRYLLQRKIQYLAFLYSKCLLEYQIWLFQIPNPHLLGKQKVSKYGIPNKMAAPGRSDPISDLRFWFHDNPSKATNLNFQIFGIFWCYWPLLTPKWRITNEITARISISFQILIPRIQTPLSKIFRRTTKNGQ